MGRLDDVEPDGLVLTGERVTLRPWRAEGGGLECAVTDSSTGSSVGSASLRLPSGACGEASIGYAIAAPARGHGYAAEAARMLAEFAFGHGVGRVTIHCDVRDVASARTALAAGFAFEGVRRGAVEHHGRQDRADFARLDTDPGTPVSPAFPPLPRGRRDAGLDDAGLDDAGGLDAGALDDGVIRLRVTTAEDTEPFTEQERDELTVRTGFAPDAPPPERVAAMVRRAGLDWLVGTAAPMTIVDLASGRFAGAVRLRRPGPPGLGSIGYAVHPAFRGSGYAARALRLLAPWAFGSGFARLELGVKVDNPASLRAAESAGFVREGVRPARLLSPDGTYADEVIFARLRPAAG